MVKGATVTKMNDIFRAENLSFQLSGGKVLNLNIVIKDGEVMVLTSNDSRKLTDFFKVMADSTLLAEGATHFFENHSIIMKNDGFDPNLKGKDEIELGLTLAGETWKYASELADKYEISHIIHLKTGKYSEYECTMLKLVLALLNRPRILFFEEPIINLSKSERISMLNYLKEYLHMGNSLIIGTIRPSEFTELSPRYIDFEGNNFDKNSILTSHFGLDEETISHSEFLVQKKKNFTKKISDADYHDKTLDLMPQSITIRLTLPLEDETDFILRRIDIIRYFEEKNGFYYIDILSKDSENIEKILKSKGLYPSTFEILPFSN